MNTPTTPETKPVELTPEQLAQAGGAAPRGGWDVPPPDGTTAAAATPATPATT
ncbi:MAG: hypothetical protein JO006_00430 [Paucibacter sp.]|nr:hypothetical protein [Roseateles sp.]